MDAFRWISVPLSLVLGLGITRLLTAGVDLFRSRGHGRLDWIPVVWGACILVWQLQYWWAIIELPDLIKVWTPGHFLALLSLTLLLFVAAALVLPGRMLRDGERLTTLFERDGRWALLFLSAYFGLAILANWGFWGVPPFTLEGGLDGALAVLPLVFLAVKRRRIQGAITLSYFVLTLVAAWVESPKTH